MYSKQDSPQQINPFDTDEDSFIENLFTKGTQEPIDFTVTINDKPKWLDIEKFKRGQKFVIDNLLGITISELFSTFLMFSLNSSFAPLLFTGNTDTPFKSFKRYVSTFSKINSWCKEDVWDNKTNRARKNLSLVRSIHKKLYKSMNICTEEEFATKTSIKNPHKFLFKDALSEDVKLSCPMAKNFPVIDNGIWVNQMNLCIGQFVLVGLAVTYPKYFGIHYAKDNDFEDFIHMWRGLGYLLGIKDEYNFCNGNLNSIRKRTKGLIENVLKPCMENLTSEWEHMGRCLVDGSGFYLSSLPFESAILYACHVLGIKTPKLRKFVTFHQYFFFAMLKFLTFFLMRISLVSKFLGRWVEKSVESAKRTPKVVLDKWEAKKFLYIRENDVK